MATLEWQGDGRWKLTVDVGTKGQRARRVRRFDGAAPTAGGNPPRAVRARAAELEVELTQHRLHLTPERVTFGQAAEAWWQWWLVAKRHERRTEVEYRRLLDRRVLPELGGQLVARMSAGQLTLVYAGWVAEGLSPSSVRRHHVLVRQVLGHAVRQHWAARNVTEDVQLPSGRAAAMNLPTLEQVLALVAEAEAQNPAAGRAVTVAFGLGLRRGELAGLRWSRVRWDEGVVVVDVSVMDRRGGREEKGTKTHQARTVPMKPWVVTVLAMQQQWQQEASAGRAPMAKDPYVFSMAPGGATAPDPDYFTQVLGRARRRAGLEGVRLHDLRHAFASYMLTEGAPLQEVSRLLGHQSTAVTAKVYSHADPTGAGGRAAIARLPDLPLRLELPPADG